jgi:predicted enzyme related to lactoylglutathione lyase
MITKANLVMVNFPAQNPDSLRDFYEDFLGAEMARGLHPTEDSWHAPISEDGIDVTINQRHDPSEQVVCYFAVDDLDEALRDAEAKGGRILWGPEDIEMPDNLLEDYRKAWNEEYREAGVQVGRSMGNAAIVEDPEGTAVGVIELARHARGHFKDGKWRQPLTDKQVRTHEKAKRLGGKHRPRRR